MLYPGEWNTRDAVSMTEGPLDFQGGAVDAVLPATCRTVPPSPANCPEVPVERTRKMKPIPSEKAGHCEGNPASGWSHWTQVSLPEMTHLCPF